MKSYRNAFNRGDIGMMIELMHKDYKGYYIGKDTIESAFSNFENFRNDMSNYFDMYPDVHSTFMSMTEEEGNIIVTEEVEWTGKKGKRKQSSLAIYQLKDDLIFRSYYFVD